MLPSRSSSRIPPTPMPGNGLPTTFADYPPHGLSPTVKKLEPWIQAGCGDKWYFCPEKNATFAPDGVTPPEMPDFSNHNNYMAEFLREHKEVYDKLKDKTTKSGVTLAMCIKTGVDNPGHPHIKTVGLTAGDEESYETFKELFDPVIRARHGGYDITQKQPTNMNFEDIVDTDIDPYNKYVLTARVRTGRSIRGFNLPPTISFKDRRKLEKAVVDGLKNLQDDMSGEYYPLYGSQSWHEMPNGMPHEKEEELRKMGNLFQEPDSTLLLASGMGRHWPDARGIFHNKDKNLFVWVNEEDHMRIVSMQRDKHMKEVFKRFAQACEKVETSLKQEGTCFMHNENLGWILTCPSNLGTGLRAGCLVTLPLLSQRSDFKALLKDMKLQARGTAGVDSESTGGKHDISNIDRIGKSEVDLVNLVITGVRTLVDAENLLENGKNDEAEKLLQEAREKGGAPAS
eukprot:Sspe_Gene.28193::Locus_12626_Transcript_1_1_Confidence_1.000_Length_1632::g.28193::m.28193/K00933/E2.7.3.2; creatine kinase